MCYVGGLDIMLLIEGAAATVLDLCGHVGEGGGWGMGGVVEEELAEVREGVAYI